MCSTETKDATVGRNEKVLSAAGGVGAEMPRAGLSPEKNAEIDAKLSRFKAWEIGAHLMRRQGVSGWRIWLYCFWNRLVGGD